MKRMKSALCAWCGGSGSCDAGCAGGCAGGCAVYEATREARDKGRALAGLVLDPGLGFGTALRALSRRLASALWAGCRVTTSATRARQPKRGAEWRYEITTKYNSVRLFLVLFYLKNNTNAKSAASWASWRTQKAPPRRRGVVV